MKYSTLILSGMLLVAISLDVTAQTKEQIDGSHLKAKINGTDWTAAEMVFDKYPSEIVQIWGDNGKTSLKLQLNKPAQGKVDQLIKTDLNSYTDEKFNMYMVYTGETKVTKMDDKWIEGIFHMTGKDDRSGKQAVITSGTFRIPNPKSFK